MSSFRIQNCKAKALFPVVLGLIVLLLPVMVGKYYLYLAKLSGIGIILALGTNIFFGYCGQVNFGVGAFYALGAYVSTLLQLNLGLNFFIAFPLTLVACLLSSLIISFPLLRLRHHTLALGTVAFASVIYLVLNTYIGVTGGEDGLAVPKPFFFGYEMGGKFNYYLILAFVVLSIFSCHWLMSSRIGRAMKAIREDEVASLSMGINSTHYRRLAFTINGVFAGLAGVLFAQETGWINPSSFHLWTNVVIILMVVVGGPGSNFGAILGGAIIMLLPHLLGSFQKYDVLIYGILLALTLRFVPEGIGGFVQKAISRIGDLLRRGRAAQL